MKQKVMRQALVTRKILMYSSCKQLIHCIVVDLDFFEGLCFIYQIVDSGHCTQQNSYLKKTSENYRFFRDALSGPRQLLAAESLLKIMKNAFYFTLKALFVLKIFKFFPDLLFMQKNGLIREIRLISKLTMLQPGKQAIEIHVLSSFSKRRQSNNEILSVNRI